MKNILDLLRAELLLIGNLQHKLHWIRSGRRSVDWFCDFILPSVNLIDLGMSSLLM